jgi:hypothetical protein
MRYRTRARGAALVALALGLAGCSGSDDASSEPTGGDAAPIADPAVADEAAPGDDADGDDQGGDQGGEGVDIVAAMTERCVATNEVIAAAEEEFAGDSPEEMAGFFDAFATGLESFAADIGELEASGDEAELVDQIADRVSVTAATFRDAIAAAETGDDPEPIIGQGFATLAEAEAAASELGIGSLQDCGTEAVEADPDATEVAVSATDYAFDIGTVAAGPTSFVMTNDGEEPHFLEVVRLSEPGVLEEALAAEDPVAAGLVVEELGGSSTVGPDQTAVFNTDLEAGTYAMLCFVAGPDGTPHAFQGMAEEFTVE